MARSSLPVTFLSDEGSPDPAPVDGDPTDGHAMANTGKTILRVTNADETDPHELTLVTPLTVRGKAVEDTTVEIPADTTLTFGALSTALYGTTVPIDVDSDELKLQAYEP
jgi:hypothetical protein